MMSWICTARLASFRRGAVVASALALVATGAILADPAQAAHVGCDTVITESTILDSDIGPCEGGGLIIDGDNVTLDLNGHTVSGNAEIRQSPDKAGIILRQVSGVTVKNGTVQGFDAGVAIMGGSANTVRGVTAQNNVNYRVLTGRDSQPADVDPEVGPFCDFGDGITAFNSNNNIITGNALIGNGPFSGISLVGDTNDNMVSNNMVRDNDIINETPQGEGTICGGLAAENTSMEIGRHSQDAGVRIEGPGAERNVVDGNRIGRSALAGVLVSGYHTGYGANNGDNVIRNNKIMETGLRTHDSEGDGTESYRASGIHLHHSGPGFIHVSHGNLIEGNISSRNFGAGIEITGPTPGSENLGEFGNTIRNNVVNQNLLDGIHLAEGTVHTTVTGNSGWGNGYDQARVAEISDADEYSNWDGVDGGDYNPNCGSNSWSQNRFRTVNQPCVATDAITWTRAARSSSAEVPADGADVRTDLLSRGDPDPT